jgi:integrase
LTQYFKEGKLNPESLSRIIRKHVKESLDLLTYEQATFTSDGREGACQTALESMWEAYTTGQHVKTEKATANSILSKLNLKLSDDQYRILCLELLKADIKTVQAHMDCLNCHQIKNPSLAGILDDLGHNNGNGKPTRAGQVPALVSTEPTMDTVLTEYQDKKLEAGTWSKTTLQSHQAKLKLYRERFGAKPVDTVTRSDVRELANGLKDRDVTTQRNYLTMLRSVFHFAIDCDYIQKNPCVVGLVPAKKKGTRTQRLPFTDQDLEKIFNPNTFLPWCKGKPSRFWVPILGLMTSCRLEELCSLYVEHVHQIDGLWVIEINEDKDRHVKNEHSVRTIPLSPVLVDMGFIKYVQSLPKGGRVFPELKKANHKYSKEFSKRFGYYLRKKVKILDKALTYHSFRHTATNHLYQKQISEALLEEFNGRAGHTETRNRYTTGFRVKTLYEECVLKLQYKIEPTLRRLRLPK